MEKIPCIKINKELWNYITPKLKEFGYEASFFECGEDIERNNILIICDYNYYGDFVLGIYNNYDVDIIYPNKFELVFDVEEFLERAAKLMNKTYKRKDMKKEFTKEDLKSGMVVKTKNNNIYLVVGNKLITNDGYILLESYDKSLKNSILSKYDILEVYSKVKCWGFGFSKGLNLALENGELIWKRKEPKEVILTMDEIAKKFGCSVEQIKIKS